MTEAKFIKLDSSLQNTKEQEEIIGLLEASREQSLKDILNLEKGLEEAKDIVRKSGYLTEKEMKEFFDASDNMVRVTKEIVNLCMRDVEQHNSLVESYEAYKEVGNYWDKEYDRRESKFKINGIRSNTIH